MYERSICICHRNSQNQIHCEHLGYEFADNKPDIVAYGFTTPHLGSNTNGSSSAPNHSFNITGLFDTYHSPNPQLPSLDVQEIPGVSGVFVCVCALGPQNIIRNTVHSGRMGIYCTKKKDKKGTNK